MLVIRILYVISVFVLLVSCTAENMIVHNAEVKSRAAYLPVHITKPCDTSRVDASIGISHNKNKNFQLIPDERLEKGEVTIVNTIIDAHFDYKVDNKIGIFAGFDGGLTDGKILFGSMLGIGHIEKYDNFAIRYDVGAGFDFRHIDADFSYNFKWLMGEGRLYDSTRGSSFAWNYFGSVTFNTVRRDNYPTLFLRIAYVNQSLFKVTTWDNLAYESEGIRNHNLLISGGVSIDLSPSYYLVIGGNYIYTFANKYTNSVNNILPFIRINYTFNVNDRAKNEIQPQKRKKYYKR
ncbi:MAG: hypothetical protein KIT33_03485 [Candidatus Kapabacteria bacterium]|nr:hypothetical protein [Ignavibacteriota bacterium]MCW5884014.1 hypothetical protein [Candidatus Kapabacteria bacterium]